MRAAEFDLDNVNHKEDNLVLSLQKYGPFAAVFSKGELTVPGYIELLHMCRPSVQIVIDRVQAVLDNESTERWLPVLFQESNWRPHLVGAIALLLQDKDQRNVSLVWSAIDGFSWATPQLVATAYLIDPEFSLKLQTKIKTQCILETPTGMSPKAKHSAMGPGSSTIRSARHLVSLLTIGEHVSELREWIQELRTKADIANLIAQDIDHSDQIANGWLNRVKQQFQDRGQSF